MPVNFDVPGAIDRGRGGGLGPASAAASPRRLSSSARVTRDDAGDARAGPGPGGRRRPPEAAAPRTSAERRFGRAVSFAGEASDEASDGSSEPEPRELGEAAPVVARGDDRGRRRRARCQLARRGASSGNAGRARTRGAREARGADARRGAARGEAAGANIARGCDDGGRRRPRRARELWRRGRGDGLPDGRLG